MDLLPCSKEVCSEVTESIGSKEVRMKRKYYSSSNSAIGPTGSVSQISAVQSRTFHWVSLSLYSPCIAWPMAFLNIGAAFSTSWKSAMESLYPHHSSQMVGPYYLCKHLKVALMVMGLTLVIAGGLWTLSIACVSFLWSICSTWRLWIFAIFNVADSYLTVGVFCSWSWCWKRKRKLKIKIEVAGARLDMLFADLTPVTSCSQIWSKEGKVLVNGTVKKSKYTVKEGDIIQHEVPEVEEVGYEAEDLLLDIVCEDQDVVVVNKPR